MATPLFERDAEAPAIQSRRIAVIGYGSQGHAHAQNLRDSGCEVRVGLYTGSTSWARAEADGFAVGTVAEATEWADLIAILLPDQLHRRVFEESIRLHVTAGKVLLLAHGFSIHFKEIQPPADVDVAMVAPVGPGRLLRQMYQQGTGIPASLAVYQDRSGEAFTIALAYAWALGCTRAGVLRTSFSEETETDLFGEQAVLCGGLIALATAGFETLVEAGYQPELAYFECIHQLKLIVDLVYRSGIAGLYDQISDTAAFGAFRARHRVVGESVRQAMRVLLTEIQDGTFARAWIEESARGAPGLQRQRAAERDSEVERIGRQLRQAAPDRGDGVE